eukprot:752987-Hanusia_phi.AAC.5
MEVSNGYSMPLQDQSDSVALRSRSAKFAHFVQTGGICTLVELLEGLHASVRLLDPIRLHVDRLTAGGGGGRTSERGGEDGESGGQQKSLEGGARRRRRRRWREQQFDVLLVP